MLAALAVVAQQSLTVYPDAGLAPHLFWLALSMFLLVRIYRHGDVARRVFLVIAAIGAVLVLPGAASEPFRVVPLAVAYVVQAVVMLTPALVAWTRGSAPASREQLTLS
jgi:hypothetical protein